MSVSSTTNRVSYNGDGTTDTFTISYPFLEKTHIKVLVDGVLKTSGSDYDVYFTQEVEQPSNPDAWGPTGRVEFVAAPILDAEVVIYRDPSPIQELVAQPNVRIPSPDIETALDRIYMVLQRIIERFAFTVRFPESFDMTTFDPVMPVPVPDGILIANEDGDGWLFKTPAEIVSEALADGGAGVPVGGDEFALLQKNSATDGDAGWTDPLSYNGYSERYSQLVALDGIKAVADFIMDMGYAPPTASLSSDVSTALRERGDLVTAMTLSATIGVVLDDIAEVRFYYDGGLIDTQTSGGAIPSGGVSTFAWTGSFGTNKTFSVQVDDDSAQSKPSVTANRSYSFVYPYYYGVGAVALAAASVAGLTKQIITDQSSANRSFTPSVGNVYYFAYPAAYASLTSILDQNGFETIADWTLRTENITGLDASAVSYKIYEFNNPVGVAGTYSYTFIG